MGKGAGRYVHRGRRQEMSRSVMIRKHKKVYYFCFVKTQLEKKFYSVIIGEMKKRHHCHRRESANRSTTVATDGPLSRIMPLMKSTTTAIVHDNFWLEIDKLIVIT